jgi:hypothetical protein
MLITSLFSFFSQNPFTLKMFYVIIIRLRDFGDFEAKYANDPNFKVDDLYPCRVNFPTKFEELFPEEEE